MKQPIEIIKQAEADVAEKIATALMDFYRATGLEPWRVEITRVTSYNAIEGYNVVVRSNRNGI